MISEIPVNIVRFLLLLLAQVLVLNSMQLSPLVGIHVFPLFILLLPFQTPRLLLLFIGFGAGLTLDFLVGSPGMHAAASVLLAFARPALINVITPKGTDFEISPHIYTQGISWFAIYLSIATVTYLFYYFIIEAGTFYNIFWLLVKVVLSTAASVFFMVIFLYLFSARKKRRFT